MTPRQEVKKENWFKEFSRVNVNPISGGFLVNSSNASPVHRALGSYLKL